MLAVANSLVVTSASWYRLWFSLAGIAALVVTFVDVVLLQRKYNIFTGGFLTSDYLKTPLDVALFLATSLIADMGLTLPLTGVALWIATQARLNAKPSVLAVLVVTLAPLMAWTFFTYQLRVYLGQVFDAALTYEIAGQNVSEIIAVAAPNLAVALIILVGGGAFTIAAIWLFKCLLTDWKQLPEKPSLRRLIAQSVIMFLAAMLVTSVAWVSSESFQQGLRPKLTGSLFASIGESFTDVDRDGYGLIRRPLDPAPLNSDIFPYAKEIPGNGIDENGVGGDLPAGTTQNTGAASADADWAFKPNVVLVLLEGFRADLLGAAYQGKVVTPVLDRLAEEGVSVPLVFSHAGFTAPSRYHLFSGSFSGARGNTSLIDDFKRNGYEVAYFSAQDVLFGGPNFDIGYARADVAYDAQIEPERRFTTFATPGSIGLPYQVITEKVSEFLESRQQSLPLFLYINFQDTHFPYYHRYVRDLISSASLSRADIGPGRAADLWATYVNTAANVDMAIGGVLEAVKRFLKDPVPGIIVTSDHGESLYDDGLLGHGIALNDIQTSVPLVVANLPVTIEQPFGLAELRDTLQRALEREPPADPRPIYNENPDRKVFQFLGRFARPRQIALRGLSGRTIYDFRTGRFKAPGGSWQRPQDLSESNVEAFRSLIHQWERQVLAAQSARSSEP